MTKSLVAAAVAAAAVVSVVPSAHAASVDEFRVWGPDRYATSADVATLWEGDPADPGTAPSELVFVASGGSFADGLAAGADAAQFGAPLLLVPPKGALPASTVAQLKRLRPTDIVIVGGLGVVGADVERQLQSFVTPERLYRYAGVDRYDTAARVAAEDYAATGRTAYLASGEDFPDALVAGAVAGTVDMPLLLTKQSVLPATTAAQLRRLKPTKVVLAGGPGAVSDAVVASVKATVPGTEVQRVFGLSRYETAAALSKTVNPSDDLVVVASGESFPDALSAGAAAGGMQVPLLLGRRTCTPKATMNEIARVGAAEGLLVGGTGVLQDGVLSRTC